jgi:hypothetical protein
VHSMINVVYAQSVAADRTRRAPRAVSASRRHRSPPARVRAAYAVARMARRLDADVARRAVA